MQNQAGGLLTCDSKLLLEREDNEEWLTSDAEKFWKKALSTSGVHLQDPLKFIKTYSRIWEYVSITRSEFKLGSKLFAQKATLGLNRVWSGPSWTKTNSEKWGVVYG